MGPKFETKPGFKIVGMMYSGRVDSGEIPELWGKFAPRMNEISGRSDKNVCYGVVDPFGSKGEEGVMHYLASVEVSNTDNIPEGMMSAEVLEAYYAVFAHKGLISNFMDTIRFVFGEWLPNSEYQMTDAPGLEIYDERFNPESEESECEFCIPVKKK